MLKIVEVQYHPWPWSVGSRESVNLVGQDVRVPFYGTPLVSVAHNTAIFLTRRYEQLLPFGPKYRTVRGDFQLLAAPHGVMALRFSPRYAAGEQAVTLSPRCHSLSINGEELRLHIDGALPSLERGEAGTEVKAGKLYLTVLRWSNFFDQCLQKATAEMLGSELPWNDVRKLIEELGQNPSDTEPRLSLIVVIAEKMGIRLASIVHSPRRILQRERLMMPGGRVTEMDAACIRWIVRQPGASMAEKAAANRQRLLAVSRRETLNTLENMVLKDFLRLSAQECRRYLRLECSPAQAISSVRGKMVKAFQTLCMELYASPVLKDVTSPPAVVQPNYVLQNDSRYREVWRLYQRLLRQEDEEDRLWDWQSRTWADIGRLLMGTTLISLSGVQNTMGKYELEEMLDSRFQIHREQMQGSRMEPGTEPGPFLVKPLMRGRSAAILELVHPSLLTRHPLALELGQDYVGGLGRVGGQLYMVVSPLEPGRPVYVIVIWIVHTAAAGGCPHWPDVQDSATRALRDHQRRLGEGVAGFPRLHGLVLASDLDAKGANFNAGTLGRHADEQSLVHLVRIPASPTCWNGSIAWIAVTLEEILELTT